ncbi:F-box domain, cyclin-like protein [Tanacetum coccineum]
MTHISLVLYIITDDIVRTIVNSCPLSVELELISKPFNDLSNQGVQSLVAWGTNVTDAGMTVLGKSNAPISCLSLRGCKRVTDEEITYLLEGEGKIGKTLSSLDLGHMPGITDNAITTIVDVCVGLLELCIRNCFHVTDETIKALALRGSLQDGKERPWLTICQDGCEVGCHDGWRVEEPNQLVRLRLNLGNTNVTDADMAVLGKGSEGKICKALSIVNLGRMLITDNAITSIADSCVKVHFFRGLIFGNVVGVSVESFAILKKPYFLGLLWIGIGDTRLVHVEDARRERPFADYFQRWLRGGMS